MSDSFPYTSEAEHVKCHYEVGENKLHSAQLYRYSEGPASHFIFRNGFIICQKNQVSHWPSPAVYVRL